MMHSYPHHTQELVIQHDKSLIDHPADYYEKIFQTERYNCYDVRYMSDSVQISNTIYLKGMSDGDIIVSLNELADKINHFNDTQFTPRLIE